MLERPARALGCRDVVMDERQVLVQHLAMAAPAREPGVAPGAEGAKDQLDRIPVVRHGALQRAALDLVAADPSAIIPGSRR